MSEKHNAGGTEITINADETLTVVWVGKRGHGSLFHLAAEGNAKHVNKLDIDEIWAVMCCARQAPYPGQRRAKVYEMVLRAIREVPDKVFPDGRPNTTLGKLRQALERTSDGLIMIDVHRGHKPRCTSEGRSVNHNQGQ